MGKLLYCLFKLAQPFFCIGRYWFTWLHACMYSRMYDNISNVFFFNVFTFFDQFFMFFFLYILQVFVFYFFNQFFMLFFFCILKIFVLNFFYKHFATNTQYIKSLVKIGPVADTLAKGCRRPCLLWRTCCTENVLCSCRCKQRFTSR